MTDSSGENGIEGGCLCGGVRYEIPDTLRDLNNCHCVDCRRASGAPFVTWGTIDTADLRLRADVRWVSHAGRRRAFAACCGTPLFFQNSADAPTLDVAVATLDAPARHRPAMNIWTEDRLPWVPLEPDLPAHPRGST